MEERHEDYCDDENCGCGDPPAEGVCLQDGRPTEKGNNFCSEYCGALWAEENNATYIPPEEEYGNEF